MAQDMIEALRELLLSDTDIARKCSNRVCTDQPAESWEPPMLVFHVISAVSEPAIDARGYVNAETCRVQIDSYGKSRLNADQLARYVEARLTNFVGTSEGVRLKISRLSGISHETDRPELGASAQRYKSRQDFQVFHNPTPKVRS